MHTGVPIVSVVRVRSPGAAVRAARPKSITFGPSLPRRMLDGLRSRCRMPASWMAASASARPIPRAAARSAGSGPYCGHVLGEREAPDVLDREPRRGLIGRRRGDQVRDPGPLDHADGQALAVETAPGLGFLQEVLADHLHRDLLAVRRDAVVHGPHPAPAETTAQRDAAELGRVGWLEGFHAHLPSSRNEITW